MAWFPYLVFDWNVEQNQQKLKKRKSLHYHYLPEKCCAYFQYWRALELFFHCRDVLFSDNAIVRYNAINFTIFLEKIRTGANTRTKQSLLICLRSKIYAIVNWSHMLGIRRHYTVGRKNENLWTVKYTTIFWEAKMCRKAWNRNHSSKFLSTKQKRILFTMV